LGVWPRVVLVLLMTLLIAGTATAGGESFDGCIDARARPVQTTIDYGLPQLALAAMEKGRAVVRYNPALMPDLPARARLFFFAHECARLALGQPLGTERSLQQARQADCWALATLQRSGEADATLAADLAVPETDWAALPGPARTVDLAACARPAGALRLPDTAPPSATQSRLNRCVHACGDRLWQCQNRCRDEACRGQCLGHYGPCESACGR
jgi:hypothetical protein